MPNAQRSNVARTRRRDPESVQADFECLLIEAEGLSSSERSEDALDCCWAARRMAKAEGLERVGEADLAIGLTLLDLDRMNEGLEAIHRAVRYFAQRGQLYLRGCAEALLAEAALRRGEEDLADRHLSVAADLLSSGAGAPALAEAFDGHARRLDAAGLPRGAAAVRRCAERHAEMAAAV